MKTREDFVSNSSSCSFVVKDVEKFSRFITFNFSALSGFDRLANTEVQLEFPKGYAASAKFPFKPDRVCSFSVDYVYTDMKSLAKIDNTTAKAAQAVRVRTEDIDIEAVIRLSALYKVLKRNGIDAEDDSERELMFQADMTECDREILRMAFGETTR